ncbi:MAG: hypothetical protein WBG69_00420 [Arcobacteraceae bacterium]
MITKILNEEKIPNVAKLKKKFNIFRAIVIKSERDLRSVEFMNKNGVFRGFGKSTKEAYQHAKKILKNYYAQNPDKDGMRYSY